jgi:hypothetical protein
VSPPSPPSSPSHIRRKDGKRGLLATYATNEYVAREVLADKIGGDIAAYGVKPSFAAGEETSMKAQCTWKIAMPFDSGTR